MELTVKLTHIFEGIGWLIVAFMVFATLASLSTFIKENQDGSRDDDWKDD